MNTGTKEVHPQLSNGKCSLYVCTSCKPAGFSREPIGNRAGFRLNDEISQALDTSEIRESVNLEAVQCLSLCNRPCGIAMASGGHGPISLETRVRTSPSILSLNAYRYISRVQEGKCHV